MNLNFKKKTYSDSYSAHKSRGGGVELDLSHEFDYIYWIFGKFKIDKKINRKISSLKISSNDHLTVLGTIGKKALLNITLNYYSKISYRKIIMDFNHKTIHLDLVKNELMIKSLDTKKNISKKIINFNRNDMYKKQHMSILDKKFDNLCTMQEALNYLNIIR